MESEHYHKQRFIQTCPVCHNTTLKEAHWILFGQQKEQELTCLYCGTISIVPYDTYRGSLEDFEKFNKLQKFLLDEKHIKQVSIKRLHNILTNKFKRMANIKTIQEGKRGCGYRKPGGIYLISDGLMKVCDLLPLELSTCPCCGEGIKFSRSFKWISHEIFKEAKCPVCPKGKPGCVPFDGSQKMMGLIWIGKQYYKTAESFTREAMSMGISRRIKSVPQGFVLGETWVLIAHITVFPKVVDGKIEKVPGVFSAFLPTEIQYVVKGDESEEELDALEERGITPVIVEYPNSEIPDLFEEIEGADEKDPAGIRELSIDMDEAHQAIKDQIEETMDQIATEVAIDEIELKNQAGETITGSDKVPGPSPEEGSLNNGSVWEDINPDELSKGN